MKIASRLLFKIILSLWTATLVFGQNDRKSDTDQINALIEKLSNHSVTADKALDPDLSGPKRKSAIDYLSGPAYQLTITPTGDVRIGSDGRAVLTARIRFRSQTNELDRDAEVRFIRRDGVWYFADFGFLGWPTILIMVLVVGILVGISYATVGLILFTRLQKRNKLNQATFFKLFIPIFWPKLFSMCR